MRSLTLLGMPVNLGQPHDGVDLAPRALRDAGLIAQIEALGWAVVDLGDVAAEPVDPTAEWEVPKARHSRALGGICQRAAERLAPRVRNDDFLLTIGGDHSIAIGSLGGVVAARASMDPPTETSVVWVDAHADFNTPATSPSGNIHGMSLALLCGLCKGMAMPGMEWLTQHLDPRRCAVVGARSIDAGERELLRGSGVHVFTMHDVDRYGIGRLMDMVLHEVNPTRDVAIHLSMDIDSLDPQEAPHTGTTVRGGLTYREGHFVAEYLAETGLLKSMDLVEINPKLRGGEGAENGPPRRRHTDPQLTVELGVELITSALGRRIY